MSYGLWPNILSGIFSSVDSADGNGETWEGFISPEWSETNAGLAASDEIQLRDLWALSSDVIFPAPTLESQGLEFGFEMGQTQTTQGSDLHG
jgi:hypothetical protein